MLQKKFRINPKKAWLFKGSFFCFSLSGVRGEVSLRPPPPPALLQISRRSYLIPINFYTIVRQPI